MRRGKKVFWGVLFILGAMALIIGKLGYLGDIGFWSVFFTIGLLGLLVEGLFNRSFGTILFSLAFLAIVNDEFLGIEMLTPWPVLGAALLGTIGLNILFPKKYKVLNYNGKKKQKTPDNAIIEDEDGEEVRCEVAFGNIVKYVSSKNLSSVRGDSAFGNLDIYLDKAELKNNQAEVRVESAFGGIVLYVPADWSVIQNVDTVLGSVEEVGHCNADGTNCLYVRGNVVCGSLKIRYI